MHAPIDANLAELLERAQTALAKRRKGNAIGIVSVKGGCGSSTIACHSAVSVGSRFSAAGKRALLIDLDLNTGVSRFILKAQSSYSVIDAVRNFQKLDLSCWQSLVCPTHPGLDVLSAPESVRADLDLGRDKVQGVLAFAKRYYDWTVVDLGRGLGQLATIALAELSELYLVATAEITPLHMTKLILRTLDEVGYSRQRVRVVLNRMPRRSVIATEEIEKVLGSPVFATLPNDYDALHECYSFGHLLSHRSRLARGIESLISRMTNESESPRTLWQRLLERTRRSERPRNDAAAAAVAASRELSALLRE